MSKWLIYIGLFLFFVQTLSAQHLVPLHRHRTITLEKLLLKDSCTHHTAIKPFIITDTGTFYQNLYSRKGNTKKWFMRKLRHENLIMKHTKNYSLTADPVFDFQITRNKNYSEYFFRNTRGYHITGRIGQNVAFHTTLFENQVAFQPYINQYINANNVIPHAASHKPYEAPFSQLATTGYDFTMAEGIVSWNALPLLNLQIGQGKHFIGDGYRSLLLSDNSYSFPFIKATANFWKIQYMAMFAEMLDMELPHSEESGFRKKRNSTQFLNFMATPWLQIGFFETTIYHPEDSTGYKGFKPNYANPIIFSRSIEYGLNSANNTLLGTNLRIILPHKIILYNQFILDEIGDKNATQLNKKTSKLGYQIGAKWFDVFNIKNLYLQTEFNAVKPYTYAANPSSQNYGHTQQPLAHPLGANFKEFVGLFQYQYHDFTLEIQANYAEYGADTSNVNYGKNIYKQIPMHQYVNNTNTHITQGVHTKLAYFHTQFSYILNPRTDMRIYISAGLRKEANIIIDNQDVFISFGLRTFLSNRLFDF